MRDDLVLNIGKVFPFEPISAFGIRESRIRTAVHEQRLFFLLTPLPHFWLIVGLGLAAGKESRKRWTTGAQDDE